MGASPKAVLATRERIAAMMARRLTGDQIAKTLQMHRATVYRHMKAINQGASPRATVDPDHVLALLDRGWTRSAVAKHFGVSAPRISYICAQIGRADTRGRGIAVPAWVPIDLRADYVDFAADFGEHYAASQVRRLKAEAA